MEKNETAGAPTPTKSYGGRFPRILAIVSWAMATGPVALLLAVVTFGVHIRIFLGRWPVVYRDVITSPALSFHELAVLVPALYLAVMAVPGWMVSGYAAWSVGGVSRGILVRQVVLLGCGYALLVMLALFDPTGYMEWLAD